MGRAIWLYKRPFRHRILRFILLQRWWLHLRWSQKPARRWYASQLDPATSISSADSPFLHAPASQQFWSCSMLPSGEAHAFSKRANAVVANAVPLLRFVQVPRWRPQRVRFLFVETPCRCRARWLWLFSLREHQSHLSALEDYFLFRERERISAPGWAHASSGLACLALVTQRGFSHPFFSTWPASLCQCAQSGLVRWKWQRAGRWQHVIGSFWRRGAVGLGSWPCPPAFVRTQHHQDGCRTSPCPLKSGWRAEIGVVSTRAALSQPSGWVVPAGCRQAPHQWSSPFFPEVDDELARSWHSPYSTRLRTSASYTLITVDGTEEKGYEEIPQRDELVAAQLCPPTAIGWKAKAAHPSKPCRTTSALAGHSYDSAGQAALALHSMTVLQVYQAKLLSAMDKSEPDPATLMELRSAIDLLLCATKTTAQAIGRPWPAWWCSCATCSSRWRKSRTQTRSPSLIPPISPNGLFGPAVAGFAEWFTEAHK